MHVSFVLGLSNLGCASILAEDYEAALKVFEGLAGSSKTSANNAQISFYKGHQYTDHT